MTIKNCLELSKRQARTVLFSDFKFPPKDENTLKLFQLKLMTGLGCEVSFLVAESGQKLRRPFSKA